MDSSPPASATSQRLTLILSYGVLLLLIYLVFRICEPFLVPLGWAAVLTIFFYPMHRWFLGRFAPRKAAIFSTLAVTVLLIVPAIFMATLFVRQALELAAGLEQSFVQQHAPRLTRIWLWLVRHVPFLSADSDLLDALVEVVRDQAGSIGHRIGTVLRNTLIFLFNLFVMIFAMFSCFRYSEPLTRVLRGLLHFEADQKEAMITQAGHLISASVATSLVLALIQGVLGGFAFALVNVPASFFWGVTMAFFSLVPVVGSAIIFVPAALWMGLSGSWGSAILILAICAGASAVIDNIVRPLLLGGRTEVSSFEIFVGVVGGLTVFGMLGLVLGPVLVATVHSVLAVYTDRSGSRAAPSAAVHPMEADPQPRLNLKERA